MLDFARQAQVEKNYFKGNKRRKELYKALEDFMWSLPGYKDPRVLFKYDGMTSEEREQVFKDYNNIKKDESYDMEHFCKDMLVSKVAYGWRQGQSGVDLVNKDSTYLYEYIMAYDTETVSKWAQELIDTVDHINHNAYTDCEGCVYNSIVYKKDLQNN